MNAKWIVATTRYASKTEASDKSNNYKTEKYSLRWRQAIKQGAKMLEEFMKTEGQVAMKLLQASKKHIVFGEEYRGGATGMVYFIDGNGIQMSLEPMGTWLVYTERITKPQIAQVHAVDAIIATVSMREIPALDVVSWLRDELNKIAEEAPE